jgi:hypothetical protein
LSPRASVLRCVEADKRPEEARFARAAIMLRKASILISLAAAATTLACDSPGANPDQLSAAEAIAGELGIPVQVGYQNDSSRLLVILPDSIFPDTASFTARAPAVAQSALRNYRRSQELDSVIVTTRTTSASNVAFRQGQSVAFHVDALRAPRVDE